MPRKPQPQPTERTCRSCQETAKGAQIPVFFTRTGTYVPKNKPERTYYHHTCNHCRAADATARRRGEENGAERS